MDLRNVGMSLSKLFKAKDSGAAETPQLYIRLTASCLKQVESLISLRVSTSAKYNHEQCRYLVDKLKMAVQSAQSFLDVINTWYSTFASEDDMARSLEIFKLLFAMGKGVESFIQGCCKDVMWIHSAILWANVSEYIASLGFNLELLTVVFSTGEKFASLKSLVAGKRKTEAKIVKERAQLDEMRLLKDVSALVESCKSGSAEWRLAKFLLLRLKSPSQWHHQAPESNGQSDAHSENLFKNLEDLEMLGQGAFGTVYKARWLGVEVAKKTFHGRGKTESFEQEVKILDGLRHPNIVPLLGYRADSFKNYMILELMDGDLRSLMDKHREEKHSGGSPFTISEALDLMLQVAEGVRFLHEKRIVHRDLKSRNILIKWVWAREVNVRYFHAKVADFGLSKTKEHSTTCSVLTPNQGTSRWMAPEMINIKKGHCVAKIDDDEDQNQPVHSYPFKSDVYSFAMVCYEILSGSVPFENVSIQDVKENVLNGERPELPNECPPGLRALIVACWNREPEKRPPFVDICAELRHLKYTHSWTSIWTRVPRCFSLGEITTMANGFNKENLLPRWSSPSKSTAYRGAIADTGEVVTVLRVLDAGSSKSSAKLSQREVEVWPRLHYHKSVTFVGFCCEKLSGRILVFQYMSPTDADSVPALMWEATINDYVAHYEDLNMGDLVAFPLQVAKLVCRGAREEAHSYRQECSDLSSKVEKLIECLQGLGTRASNAAAPVGMYERPTRRIMLEVVKVLETALVRVRNCRRTRTQLKRMISSSSLRKVNHALEKSIGNVSWLIGINNCKQHSYDDLVGMPPCAADDPVISPVWELVSIVQVGTAKEQADAAERLIDFARNNAHYVKIIIQEGGAPPLLRLLQDGTTVRGQEAAAAALGYLATDEERVRQLRSAGASGVLAHILGCQSSPSLKVQLQVARIVATIASLDEEAQTELASQGAIRSLLTLLAHQVTPVEGVEDEDSTQLGGNNHKGLYDSSFEAGIQDLKAEAAHALWKLAAGNTMNCKLITDTSALRCFAKLMKHSAPGKLKNNAVMVAVEIAAAAEGEPELFRAAFNTDSPAAEAFVQQLLEEITRENGEPELQVSCCKAIGSLARIFPVPAELPIRALTSALANQNADMIPVATEAAFALSKFASDESYLHRLEHSKSIIAVEGALDHLVLLAGVLNLPDNYPEPKLIALELLGHLSLNVPESEALAKVGAIYVLRSSTTRESQLFQLFAKHDTARQLIRDAIAKLEAHRSPSFQARYG